MSDAMLLGVLRMPHELWRNDPIDIAQRHSRYVEAADRIERLKNALHEACRFRDALCRNSDPDDSGDPREWDDTLKQWLDALGD